MVKRVAVVTFSSEVGDFYCKQLKGLFGESIDVEKYSFDNNTIDRKISGDVIVISTYAIYEAVRSYIGEKSEIVITNITISKNGLNQIMNIPSGTKAMLVNLSAEMCIETISLLYQLGANHVEFVPVYPGIKDIPEIDIAVTPGEMRYVPDSASNIIDIGHRLLDMSTIVEIALKLKFEHLIQSNIFKNYFDKIARSSYSLLELTGKTNRLESQFDILFKILDEGIVGVNSQGIIFAYSKSAERIIGIGKDKVLNKRASEVLAEIPFETVSTTLEPIKSKLIKIKDVPINLNVAPVMSEDKFIGAFAIVQKFKDAEYQQHKLRSQLLNKGYRAKYTFDDIIGKSPEIVHTKEIAYKMSRADSPVLITGESGTGKELFAQSIHNSSLRCSFPFVAVNCAAIPENLLESELFGYEEGAFTGAKRGGKLGLFEFAHMGTLFLDEIEGMSLGLQAKLLRVIQEREVMRIGGDSIINIDVRIIAATNEDLRELVKRGSFRKDLYYRLNVLPLNIPPLRDRGEDVLLLIEKIKKDLNSNFEMSPDLKKLFINHSWDGNVRELRNYIEYLTYMGNKKITPGDLPSSFLINHSNKTIIEHDNSLSIEEFKAVAENRVEEYLFVLNQLYLNSRARISAGRRSLAKAAEEKNIFLTEPEIRTILINLDRLKLIKTGKGRSGSKITEEGINILNKIKMG